MIHTDSKHILILVIEKCLAKFLPDKQSPFGSDLTGGKRLYYVLALASASPCADCLPDVSELFTTDVFEKMLMIFRKVYSLFMAILPLA